MLEHSRRLARPALLALTAALACGAPARTQVELLPPTMPGCEIDLSKPGQMRDVLSNALTLGLEVDEAEVREFLEAETGRAADGNALLLAAARRFAKDRAMLVAAVARYRHCNCDHAPLPGQVPLPQSPPDERAPASGPADVHLTPFANDVLLHVVLHELGHALVREFDLPVLANEETLADAFATHFLVHHLPARAEPVLRARVASLMIEARQVARADWPVNGEHDNDARRAFSIAALAVAVDPDRYARVAELAGLTAVDVRKARDYGPEVHRSWRRTLRPLWMPPNEASDEARLRIPDGDAFLGQLAASGLAKEIDDAVRRFDWHSQVTILFEPGDGAAAWNRSTRTITIKSGYLRRFVEQGKAAGF
ncbi:MAG: hypothetical protein IPK26_04575 [Planctomycetes bacterium]|nr:hypothetical protein [Planctomycetota bacterium]